MQTKRFQVYQAPKKCINNTFQLRVLTKKNIKTLKNLECEEIPIGDDDFSDSRITEGPRLAKLLKRNKLLSSFKHINYSHKPEKCLPIFPALKNLRSLSTFHLKFSNDQSFKPQISQAFTLCTKNLKHLANLDCSLDRSVTSPIKSLQTLHFIAPLHSLSRLSLRFHSTLWLTNKSWSTFSYHVPHLTSLTSLSLNLSYAKGFTQTSLRETFLSLSKLPLLTSFGLKAYGSELLDFLTLIFLFKNLQSLSNFQDLTLSLWNCNRLKFNEKEPLAIGLGLLNPSSFRKLSLEFYPNFSDFDLSELLIVIQRFSSLKHLSLGFSKHTQITSKSFSGLPATLAQFASLVILKLLLSPKIETGSFFEVISLYLKDLKELVSLTLDTWSSLTIDNIGIQLLCSQFPSLPKLQHLDLNLGRDSRLDEKCIESMSQALLKLTDLKSLHLDCRVDENYMDSSIFSDLIKSVGCLTHLRKLGLSLGGYIDLKKEMVETVTASLKSLNCLAELYLNFDMRCTKDEIGKQFKNLISSLESQEALIEVFIVIPSFTENYPFRGDQSFMDLVNRVENGPKKFHIYGDLTKFVK